MFVQSMLTDTNPNVENSLKNIHQMQELVLDAAGLNCWMTNFVVTPRGTCCF